MIAVIILAFGFCFLRNYYSNLARNKHISCTTIKCSFSLIKRQCYLDNTSMQVHLMAYCYIKNFQQITSGLFKSTNSLRNVFFDDWHNSPYLIFRYTNQVTLEVGDLSTVWNLVNCIPTILDYYSFLSNVAAHSCPVNLEKYFFPWRMQNVAVRRFLNLLFFALQWIDYARGSIFWAILHNYSPERELR